MNKISVSFLLLLCLSYSFSSEAQHILINEVVASNSEYFDQDGNTPNWIELYNF